MIEDVESTTLRPFDFNHIEDQVPELKKFNLTIETLSFKKPIDSSNMNPAYWTKIARAIEDNYDSYDGFVILHGSDTMAYTASALSFMLENLSKPVIVTGSQLPIGTLRTDGKENLISAVEIASSYENDLPVVPEVAIYFEFQLYRGNRTSKVSTEVFDAFKSFNYPDLAQAGINIVYNKPYISSITTAPLSVFTDLNDQIAILKLYPGITHKVVHAILSLPDIKAVIIETYGSGNATTEQWFLNELTYAKKHNIIVYNVTQCVEGSVNQGMYETSGTFDALGVVSGYDITIESAVAKLMYLLGKHESVDKVKELLLEPLRGELTPLVH